MVLLEIPVEFIVHNYVFLHVVSICYMQQLWTNMVIRLLIGVICAKVQKTSFMIYFIF